MDREVCDRCYRPLWEWINNHFELFKGKCDPIQMWVESKNGKNH